MTLFEALDFFHQLGTTWYDQHLESTMRTNERFAQFREAEAIINASHTYRILSREQGREVALAAFDLYDTRRKNDDYIIHQILSNLAKFVPGALHGLYHGIIERQLYWGDGVTFREAGQDICTLLLELLDTDLEAQPYGHMIRENMLEALAWIEVPIAVEAFQRWHQHPPAWAKRLSQPPEQYTSLAGWELTAHGQKRFLYYPECHELVPWNEKETTLLAEPVSVYTPMPAEETCPSCYRQQKYLFTLHVSDPRLMFLKTSRDRIVVPMCPFCEGFDEDHPSVKQPLMLGPACTPYETIGSYWTDGLSHIGGHPEWVQYPEYPLCEQCHTTMTFIAQLGMTDIDPELEGIAYAFLCSHCEATATRYQCT